MSRRSGNLVTHVEALMAELEAAGHDVALTDLLDCLASAGLVIAPQPDDAAQAYFEHVLKSLEQTA